MPPGGFLTHEKAEEGFVFLLKKEGIDETWAWDQAMRKIVLDPLYKALNTLAEKKETFEKVCVVHAHFRAWLIRRTQYTQSIVARRRAVKEARIDRLRPILHKLFAASPQITSYSTTKTADVVFSRDRNWREARPDERRMILEDYTSDFRRREEVSPAITRSCAYLLSDCESRVANSEYPEFGFPYPSVGYYCRDTLASSAQYHP